MFQGGGKRGKNEIKIPLRSIFYCLVVLVLIIFTYMGWRVLYQQEENSVRSTIRYNSDALNLSISNALSHDLLPLKLMAERWKLRGGTPKKEWMEDAGNLINSDLSYQAIEWVDSSYHVRWVAPLKGNEKALNLNLAFEEKRKAALDKARSNNNVVMSQSIDLVQGGKGVLFFVPIILQSRFDGFILGVFRLNKSLKSILSLPEYQNFNVEIYESEKLIFAEHRHSDINMYYAHSKSFQYNSLRWTIKIMPDEHYISALKTRLSSLFLIFGILISLLTAVTLYFLNLAWGRSLKFKKAVESLNLVYNSMISIVSISSFDEAIKKLLTSICQTMHWPIAHAYVLDNKKQQLISSKLWFIASGNYAKFKEFIAITHKMSFKKGIGLPGRVLATKAPVWIDNIHKDDNFPRAKLCQNTELYSAFALPIFNQGKIIAIAEFFSPTKVRSDSNFLKTLDLLSTHVSSILYKLKIESIVKDSELKYRNIITNAVDTIIMINDNGIIYEYNKTLTSVFGYGEKELLGKNIKILMPSPHAELHDHYLDQYRKTGVSHTIGTAGREVTAKCKNGNIIPVWLSISEIELHGKRFFVGTLRDISVNKKHEKQLERLANYDHLTKLMNRFAFDKALQQKIALANRFKRNFSVMVLDVDDFKKVNDELGHDVGDALLKKVAHCLLSCLRETDIVARLGGDEFAIILDGIEHTDNAIVVAKKILLVLKENINIRRIYFTISASIGIAHFPEAGNDAAQLLKHADIAMYRAKNSEKNHWIVFSKELNAKYIRNVKLEHLLSLALANKELYLVYQPQYNMLTNKIVGLEVLLRWNHPEMGLISPDVFIPIAEKTGEIASIGHWVLEQALQQYNHWQKAIDNFSLVIKYCINVSPKQFIDKNTITQMERLIKKHPIKPNKIAIEITETAIMKDDHAVNNFNRLVDLGVDLVVDDFGTGYASLRYLQKLPITSIKIDKSFVSDITTNENTAGLVKAIIAVSKILKLNVVAEGVINKQQKNFLIDNGCYIAQGYYLSKPLVAEEIGDLLHKALS